MRRALCVLIALMFGLVAGYAATVVGAFTYVAYAGIFDRDGGLAMGIAFFYAPLGALVVGLGLAVAVFLRFRPPPSISPR